MNGKKIIVPKGENPMQFLKKVRTSDSIVYFHSKLLKELQTNGILVSNTSDRLVIIFDKEELTFNNGYNMVHHQLLKIGDKSYAPIRRDVREKILIFEIE